MAGSRLAAPPGDGSQEQVLGAAGRMYLEQRGEVLPEGPIKRRANSISSIRFHIDQESERDTLYAHTSATTTGDVAAAAQQQQTSVMSPSESLSKLTVSTNGDAHHHRSDSENGSMALSDSVRTVLVWQDLTVSAPIRGSAERKILLNNVSGSMTGGMWAIMGPSGCGKSTLLNTLACRLDVNTHVTGEMRLNGRPYHNAELKKMSGYVMQDDLLNPNLTVRETLRYTAALRLPRSVTEAERLERVEEVIREMGLAHCADVIVGDPSKKGISGGERRRVCVGMELITRPTLLFLDEPTSGLDSVTSLALIQLLHKITRTWKCSMMISIHQPQAKIFQLFDRLLLLKSGRILFQGSIPACLQLFEDCGFPVPHYSNPADHILDMITPPLDPEFQDETMSEIAREVELKRRSGRRGNTSFDIEYAVALAQDPISPRSRSRSRSRANSFGAIDDILAPETPLSRALERRRSKAMDRTLELEKAVAMMTPMAHDGQRPDQKNEARLLEKFDQPTVDLGLGASMPLFEERDGVSWWRQVRILMSRNWQETMRKQSTLWTALIQTIIMAVLIGLVYLRIGTGQSSTVRRQPSLFFVCINQGMIGALSIINSYPAERALMLRERAAGTYYTSSYFLAKTTVDTLSYLHLPIVFSIITYWMIGYQPDGSKFMIYMVIMTLCQISAMSLALMVSALCKTTDLAVTVLPMVLECARLFGAFYLSPKNQHDYLRWLDAVSYVQYSYIGASLNELEGLKLTCKPNELQGGVCPNTSGEQYIDRLGLDYISIEGCIGVLFLYIFVCRLISYLAIRYLKTN